MVGPTVRGMEQWEHLKFVVQRAGGALITIGSIVSDIPSPGMGAYAASKHAVKGYVDSLRIEINADRLPISVTLVKPSGIGVPPPPRRSSSSALTR